MKILLVHPYWHYRDVTFELPRLLLMRGEQPFVMTWVKGLGETRISLVEPGIDLIELPGVNLLPIHGTIFPLLKHVGSAFEYSQAEVVDCQSHLFLTSLQAVLYARRMGIPSVVTVNGIKAPRKGALNLAQFAYLNTLSRLVFRAASAVRCLTESDAVEANRLGCPWEKISIIPNGVDTTLFRPGPRDKDSDTIVWTGRFVEEKGLPTLLRAAVEVIKTSRNIRFMLVGDGPLRQRIEEMAERLGVYERFVFTGAVSRCEVARILRSSTLFVMPSFSEGMPLSLLEAMSCGNPVVGSDIPGISSVVRSGETGILVPPGDHRALGMAISGLLGDRCLLRRMGERAAFHIRKNYEISIIVMRVLDLYSKIRSCSPS
ncbi:MAG: glycosyltransferase family 4 protein [Candidatus Verstraetearchaeota archaeon]|nr:glycosyltransferase family 4 protein [Candidatus Verstraetearchaeota archaeon]